MVSPVILLENSCSRDNWYLLTLGVVLIYMKDLFLSGRGLCDELITRSEQSYRAWVFVCDPQNLKKRESKSELGCCDKEEFPTSHFLHTAVTPFPLTMDSQNATHMIAFPLNSVNKFVTDIRFRCDLQQQRCNFFHSQNNLTYSYRCNTHCLEYSQWQH